MLLNKQKLLTDRERLGRWGEKRCEKFLKRKGLCKTGELDLVMVDTDGSIVFVEVRTKAGSDFATPEDSITKPKKTRLLRTARYFLATNNIEDRPYRLDIVTIVLGQTGHPQIRHYENAFVP
ncbi:MAG: YraN family protein [Planctomycetota bacterium]